MLLYSIDLYIFRKKYFKVTICPANKLMFHTTLYLCCGNVMVKHCRSVAGTWKVGPFGCSSGVVFFVVKLP